MSSLEHVELAAELHVAAHDQVHEAVRRAGRARWGRRPSSAAGEGPRGPVDLDRAEQALVGLVARGSRRVPACRRRRAAARHQRRAERPRRPWRAATGSQRAASRGHSHCARTVHWNPTGSELPRKSGYIGGGRGELDAARLDARERRLDLAVERGIAARLHDREAPDLAVRGDLDVRRDVQLLELIERNLCRGFEGASRTRRSASAGSCRRRAPSAGRSRCRSRRLARRPRSTRPSPRRPSPRAPTGFAGSTLPASTTGAAAAVAVVVGTAAAVFSALVEGSGAWGWVFAATGCLRCHCDGSLVGRLAPELEHRRDGDGDRLRVVVRDVRLHELRRRHREDRDEHQLGEQRRGAGDRHVLRVEVAPRAGAHGFSSSGSTSKLRDVTPATRAAATARATTP